MNHLSISTEQDTTIIEYREVQTIILHNDRDDTDRTEIDGGFTEQSEYEEIDIDESKRGDAGHDTQYDSEDARNDPDEGSGRILYWIDITVQYLALPDETDKIRYRHILGQADLSEFE